MRIGIDLRVAAGSTGQQRYLWELGRWLAARGHEVELLVTRHDPPEAIDGGCAGVHALAALDPGQLVARVREMALDVLVLNPERSDDYDGIRANVLRPGYGTDQYRQKLRSFPGGLERSLRSALRGLPPTRGKRERERRFYEGHTPQPEVLAVSDYMRREILDTYRLHPERVHVVPNGIDLETFSPDRRAALRAEARKEFGIPEGALCILIVAHNYRLKGVRMGMDQVRRLREVGVDAHLLVAGRGTGAAQRSRARGWAVRMGISGATHLPGAVHPAIRAYAAADLFLHPSWHDAFGFVVLEAMGAGLPPLTSPWAGAAMLVDEGRAGFVVDPADTGTIYRRLRELSDPGLRNRMGAEARRIAERYGEEANFARVEEVCRIAADRQDGPIR
jgi:UDP-glucose:(heptosyl)LPS alpha-1,3-glucosyltransferase